MERIDLKKIRDRRASSDQTNPDLVSAFEAIAEQFQLIQDQQEQITELKAEVAALKGGGQ